MENFDVPAALTWFLGIVILGWDRLLDIVQRFQTLIAATVAFIGVRYTLKKNAEIAAGQRLHEVHHAEQKRLQEIDHKRLVIATALQSELKQLQQTLESMRESNLQNAIFHVSSEDHTPAVYSSLISDIGTLDQFQVQWVIYSHFLRRRLFVQIKEAIRPYPAGMGQYIAEDQHYKLLANLRLTERTFDTAIVELRKTTKD